MSSRPESRRLCRRLRRWLRSSTVPLAEDLTHAIDVSDRQRHIDQHSELQRQLGALLLSRKAKV